MVLQTKRSTSWCHDDSTRTLLVGQPLPVPLGLATPTIGNTSIATIPTAESELYFYQPDDMTHQSMATLDALCANGTQGGSL